MEIKKEIDYSIDGKSKIGKNTIIFKGAVIINSEIGDNAKIGQYTIVRDSKIGNGTIIGPHSEITRSKIGDRSGIFHKGTIVDAEIGKEVMTGANVVTANNNLRLGAKYKTIIMDKANIGSNVVLLAPITVGENSIIGANAFINKDVPSNKIVYNKKELVTRDNDIK